MPRKEFEAFTRLDASDVNSFLMDQTVMSFADAAARGSAIPTPVEGMYTHLEDSIQRTQFWNGSAWRSPSGETLIATSDFSAQTSVSIDNIFTSEFEFYRIVASIVADSSASNMAIRLRDGSDLAGSGYTFNFIRNTATSVTGQTNTGTSSWRVGVTRTNNTTLINITLGNPAKSGAKKNYLFHEFNQDGSTTETNVGGGFNSVTTVYDGFKLLSEATTNFSGTLRVYGLRNS
jgi:hypothetical protein